MARRSFYKWLIIMAIILEMVMTTDYTFAAKGALSIPELVNKCGVAVVMIFRQEGSKITGLGSGINVDPKGVIVTNFHVVKNADAINVKFKSGEVYRVVKILNLDKIKDICILKIEGFALPTIALGNSNNVAIGQNAVAIGNPQGFENTVSNGIISGRRTLDGLPMLQTTVPISPGSSGGPLINEQGEVIGITTLSWAEENSQSINFAIPVNFVRGMLDAIPGAGFQFSWNDLKVSEEKNDGGENESADSDTDKYKEIYDDDLGTYYINTQTIRYVKNSGRICIDVELIWLITPKCLEKLVSTMGTKYRKTKLIFNHYLIDFKNLKMCTLRVFFMDVNNEVIDDVTMDPEWDGYYENSSFGQQFKRVAEYARTNL